MKAAGKLEHLFLLFGEQKRASLVSKKTVGGKGGGGVGGGLKTDKVTICLCSLATLSLV